LVEGEDKSFTLQALILDMEYKQMLICIGDQS